MQIISIYHRCLLFKFNKKKFLLGLTSTLAEDCSALSRIKTDYLILPSFPYLIEQSLFFWHLDALQLLNCHSIVTSDVLIKKRIQSLMGLTSLSPNNYKWELLKQHELNQQQLLKVYEQVMLKNQQSPLLLEPNGLGYNDRPDKLNFIVSEQGRSIILVHESDTILIDPSECIEQTFNFYGLPFASLRAVILTKPNNSNMYELLFKTAAISVITTEPIYAELKKFIKNYFLWDEQMIRKKLRGKILTEQLKYSKYRGIDILFKAKNGQSIEYLDLLFGLKRVRLYPWVIERYPSEVIELKDLELLFVYQMEELTKKELESSPEAYRKKIVFNRVNRKYNNKYFYTIHSKQDVITVHAHHYKREQLKHALQDLSFMFKHRDQNYCLTNKEMGDGEKFNANGRVVYVRQGYVRDEKGKLFGINGKISEAKEIIGVRNAIVMYQSTRNVYFNEGSKLVDPHCILAIQDLLKKIRDNSFVKSLKRTKELSYLRQVGEQEVENGSEWQILNSICSFKTFEAGFDLGNHHNIYFVVKGCMKYRNEEALATKGMGIGSMKKFYNSTFEDNDQIQVVKDSWAIQISLKELHKKFFTQFPSKMYELFIKPNIFK